MMITISILMILVGIIFYSSADKYSNWKHDAFCFIGFFLMLIGGIIIGQILDGHDVNIF